MHHSYPDPHDTEFLVVFLSDGDDEQGRVYFFEGNRPVRNDRGGPSLKYDVSFFATKAAFVKQQILFGARRIALRPMSEDVAKAELSWFRQNSDCCGVAHAGVADMADKDRQEW